MPPQDPSQAPSSSGDPDAGSAVRGFVRTLVSQALFEHTARLEVTLGGGGALETLLAVERALTWPPEGPSRELIWATEAGALRLSAYDQAGRLLLKRDYGGRHG